VLLDFLELPSQLFEHWMQQPEVLKRHVRDLCLYMCLCASLLVLVLVFVFVFVMWYMCLCGISVFMCYIMS
jgi:hypothetical protein